MAGCWSGHRWVSMEGQGLVGLDRGRVGLLLCEGVVVGGLALEPGWGVGGIWNALECDQWYAGGGALSGN